ncbi:MAG: hypothetical protein HS117_22285 [Verrucomicrobiaceae bacterium]|nr:hypothetical protein [Verrucomicrobiaceae bacterium]
MTAQIRFSPALAVLAAAFLLEAPAMAAPQGTQGVQNFDPLAFPGQVVDDVVVPVPSEVFSVLDKLGEPNWNHEIREVDIPTSSDRTRLSLLFGYVVAEGFVAVQAEDKEAVKEAGRDVISLAKALGLSKSVLPHAQSILDAADRSDWKAIRKEFDRTQQTVRVTMEEMKDADLSQCVSLGGWLRGTASVTSVVKKAFSADRAELLNQPMLVEHFVATIGKMPASTREHDLLRSIRKGLDAVLERMESAVDGFTKDAVADIGITCERLLSEITTAKK